MNAWNSSRQTARCALFLPPRRIKRARGLEKLFKQPTGEVVFAEVWSWGFSEESVELALHKS
ncbi:hypothetical protein ACTXT7_000562 [Hymenolepis weldensis]